ncbi:MULTISPECIES: lytic polysaccharide monooxygenase [unclassified Enterococcus]|uniref:lytic polysaccharide monooxygenase n=1 Tax=unclassified Enterococcus TaxID=2608891 RepID=UPI001CE0FD90|nr:MULTISPECIES: lytic polysaccharide monooxygenase [unclassified Enterococcus]MCA5012074.1 lytic polysaccharide monooxygenase [Enterococcus sp. S23]MCA5015325.1 lytic polysaccharide monooxygenase [Enterococcus sp. S22(2020)]
MKKSFSRLAVGSAVLFVGAGLLGSQKVDAHGYIKEPISRAYQGSLEASQNHSQALSKYGPIIYEPQSLEAPKGFPARGPQDGKLASANGVRGFQLDATGADTWKKQPIETGVNNFEWYYTQNHRTTKWHYYMTKQGWNPDEPLKRANLELITEIPHDGSQSKNGVIHKVNIPANRSGYHVIYAAWDVADTGNAFYQAVDVDVSGGSIVNPPIEVAPSAPTEVKATEVTNSSAKLSWKTDSRVKEYNVYRNNQKIATVDGSQFVDTKLAENTTYSYQIEAVGTNGKVSEKSQVIRVITQKTDDANNQLPTAPKYLHTMGVTSTTASLMWADSTHASGIRGYEIYRNDRRIGVSLNNEFEDIFIQPGTTYTYKVKALANNNTLSEFSQPLNVTTPNK